MHPLRARPSARPRHTGQAPVPRGAGGPEADSRRLKGPHPRSGASTDCATLTRPEVSCPNSLSKPKPGTGHSPPQRQWPPQPRSLAQSKPPCSSNLNATVSAPHGDLPLRAAGRFCGVSAPSFSSGTAPCASRGERGGDSAAQPRGFGLLTCKRGARALNSKEKAEGAERGRHPGRLPRCRHCQSLGASWRKGHLGQQRGSGKAWRKARESGGQGLAGLELGDGRQPLESQDGQQGPQRADRGEMKGHSHRLPSGGAPERLQALDSSWARSGI